MPRTKLLGFLRQAGRGSLRTHLFALVLVSIVPILIFAVLLLNLFARQEKASLATGLRETARALTSAMEREFDAAKTALEAVATMEALDSGDLAEYYRTLRRILQSRPNWKTILMHKPTGEQVLNLLNPFGEPLPPGTLEPEQFRTVVHTKQPAAVDFHLDPRIGPAVGIRVPVLRAGELKYILSAELDPKIFGEILGRQKLPAQAVATIIDGGKTIVATSGRQELVGKLTGPLIGSAPANQMDGWLEGLNRDGVRSYAAISRSPGMAWSVSLVVPAALLDNPLKRSLWALGGAGVIFLVAGILGAVVIESRICGPLAELTRKAEALGRGDAVPGGSAAPITEVENLGRDILRAAALLSERSRERDTAAGALRDLNQQLERRISERTEQLEDKNGELRREIAERHAAEEALRAEHVYLNLLRRTELVIQDAASIEAIFSRALDEICRHLGAPVGHAVIASNNQDPEPVSLWYGDPQRAGVAELRAALTGGDGQAGGPAALAFGRGQFVAMDTLAAQAQRWAQAAQRAGVRAALALPVRADGKIAGALAVFSELELQTDARLSAIIDQLALQLGRAVERKQAEEALRLSEEQFRLSFDEGPMAICMIATDLRIVRVNRALCELLGRSKDELLGQSFAEFTLPEDRPASGQRAERLLRGAVDRYVSETRLIGRSGEILTCCVSAALIASPNGAPGYAVKLIEDITQRKRMEEKLRESERLAAVGATSAMLAHEVGNPLNGISTTVQMIERDLMRARDGVKPVVFGALTDIKNEITRLGALLHEFRFLARPQHLNLQPASLALLVRDVLAADSYETRGIEVVVDVPETLPLLCVDHEKLKQALAKLAENAADAMPKGGRLTVLAQPRGDEVWLEVRDTGTGIAPGVNVFELFTTTKPHGTGLGLAVVRQIVSAHGGYVEYHSEPGAGTVFVVALPVDNSIAASSAPLPI